MNIGMVIALIKALGVKTIESLKTASGASAAGKVLAIDESGNVIATTLSVESGTVAVDTSLSISGAAAESTAVRAAITLTDAEVTSLTGLLN